uniref:Uncharacterized protein LOC114344238 n=1 Tax=Diabrotica virgifera virgifera TaxID=50390 RepID=A0A6P7GXT6_DIAVI
MESGKQDFKNKRSQPRDTERRYDQRDQKRDSGFRGKRDSDRSESGRRFENGNNSDRRSFNNNSGGNRFNRSQASRNEDNRASEANVEDEEEWGVNLSLETQRDGMIREIRREIADLGAREIPRDRNLGEGLRMGTT